MLNMYYLPHHTVITQKGDWSCMIHVSTKAVIAAVTLSVDRGFLRIKERHNIRKKNPRSGKCYKKLFYGSERLNMLFRLFSLCCTGREDPDAAPIVECRPLAEW
jgi:hypothetical protein